MKRFPHLALYHGRDHMYPLSEYAQSVRHSALCWSRDRQVLSLFGASCVRVETPSLHTWHSGATGLSCRDSGLQLFSPQAVSDRVSGLVQTSVLPTLHVLQR